MNIPTSSRVMHMAHKLLVSYPTLSWSDVMKLAWQFYYLRKMLQSGIVKFRYLKTSDIIGEARRARGTLHPELIPTDKQPKDSPLYTPNYETMSYYDLDVQGWRSFRLDLLQDIEGYAMLSNVDINSEQDWSTTAMRA